MQVDARFLMNAHHVGTEVTDTADIAFGLFNHEMHVKGLSGVFGNGFHNRKTETDVWNEVSVHYVKVEPVRSTVVYALNVVGQMTEIGRKE